jgi:hypothetical protein
MAQSTPVAARSPRTPPVILLPSPGLLVGIRAPCAPKETQYAKDWVTKSISPAMVNYDDIKREKNDIGYRKSNLNSPKSRRVVKH